MGIQVTSFTPAWARNAVMTSVLRMFQHTDADIVSESDLIAESISRVPAFDDLPEDTQHLILDLLSNAVGLLVDDDVILVDEIFFQINPDLPDLLIRKHEMCVLPKWGSA
jgi:hypothetical protein